MGSTKDSNPRGSYSRSAARTGCAPVSVSGSYFVFRHSGRVVWDMAAHDLQDCRAIHALLKEKHWYGPSHAQLFAKLAHERFEGVH